MHHYIPILKSKEAEFLALAALEPDVKFRLTPLIDLVTQPTADVDTWVSRTAKKIAKAWPVSRPLFVDAPHLGAIQGSTGESALVQLVQVSGDENLNIVPVTGLSRAQGYQDAVRKILKKRSASGACLRLQGEDFDADFPSGAIASVLGDLKIQPENVDLLLDFGELSSSKAGPFAAQLHSYLGTIPNVTNWRTLTVSATAFPRHLGGLGQDTHSAGLANGVEGMAYSQGTVTAPVATVF